LRLEDIAGDELTCAPTATGSIGKWTDDPSPQDAEQCIQQGIWDYCQSLKIPEVIDPTDQIFNSGETWGMTGSLIDSGVAAKFGSSRPLIVMKGYVTPPVDKDNETVIPQGIIHENKDDLRMGAMHSTTTAPAPSVRQPMSTTRLSSIVLTARWTGPKSSPRSRTAMQRLRE